MRACKKQNSRWPLSPLDVFQSSFVEGVCSSLIHEQSSTFAWLVACTILATQPLSVMVHCLLTPFRKTKGAMLQLHWWMTMLDVLEAGVGSKESYASITIRNQDTSKSRGTKGSNAVHTHSRKVTCRWALKRQTQTELDGPRRTYADVRGRKRRCVTDISLWSKYPDSKVPVQVG